MLSDFTIKDSGKRASLGGGVRDTEDGKTDFTLILDGPMYDRWAEHLTKGAIKYAARNWMEFKSDPVGATERAKRSLGRHYRQYMRGDTDEDHGAAIFFNINVIEYLKGFMETGNDYFIFDKNSTGGPVRTGHAMPGEVVTLGENEEIGWVPNG